MGSGKTTVARALAQRLSCEMIDLDSFITQREGRSPAEIIEQDGETSFREIETRTLRDVLATTSARVIALGGGAWTVESNRTLVARQKGSSVWLDAPFELCWKRIRASEHAPRPLAPDRETAKKLFKLRQSSYSLADLQVSVNDTDTDETLANKILTHNLD
jgi:shikimate kinase